jgi:diketogulonate reductase-like aldo/keto reductase
VTPPPRPAAERLERVQELTELRLPGDCADYNPMCQRWSAQGSCSSNQQWMHEFCRLACGLCSLAPPKPEDLARVAGQAERSAGVGAATYGAPLQRLPLGNCRDTAGYCDDWASSGQCAKNPSFMLTSCKQACGLCFAYWLKRVPRALRLANGRPMPAIGFGTAALGDGTQEAVRQALLAGYRHIDSAQAREWYREDLVGRALAQVPQVARTQLFLTSKLHPRHLGYQKAKLMFQQSLTDLGTDYLDLFLLHYPNCWGDLCGGVQPEGTWRDSWRALEELHRAGKAKAIGVSNFDLGQMKELLALATVRPAVLQTHADPFNQNGALLSFCQENGVVFTAYSTLGTQAGGGGRGGNPVLQDPSITAIARDVDRTVVQVVLRWALQRGMVVLPRSASAAHMAANLAAYDFELPALAMQRMMALDGARPGS